ncbi:MAG: Starch synthase catalytic domain protein [Bacteroidetes bacterium 38_7]|nr:MAG: Starch synthase catalytic domain protein [Bacteroidetes bacterium 38_7]
MQRKDDDLYNFFIMTKARVLFVSQEIVPYLKDSPMGRISRYLPQGIQEKGKEIRTFMPRYGHINERRNQLHEVIRLSGINIIIDNTDRPLIIKVASIQQARMQVYFIDNDDYFARKFQFYDKNDKFFKDNDERAVFFSRGVLETVKKLGWNPDIIHCHGWFTSLLPLYVKTAYKDNPIFSDAKIIVSLYDDDFEGELGKTIKSKIKLAGIKEKHLTNYKKGTFVGLMQGALDFADGAIIASQNVNPEILNYLNQKNIPILPLQDEETYIDAYNDFYEKILKNEKT